MKRILTVLTILFASVLTTACINNFAIQELNNKAKVYLDAGDAEKAICRYKSSLDLDASVFETNYNLGVAYITIKSYSEAINILKNAIKINPEIPDTYYSLAVAQENIGFNIINGVEEVKIKCTIGDDDDSDEISSNKEKKTTELSTEDKKEITELFMLAIDNYNHYLMLSPTAPDKDKVAERVEDLNKELIKYSPRRYPTKTED